MGYSFQLAARVLLYLPSHRQDNTYHGLCYTSRGALAGTSVRSTSVLCNKKLTRSMTMSRIFFLAPSTQSFDPLMMTSELLTPLRGKLTVTPPYSSAICRSTSPRRATKWRWCLGSTLNFSSTMLSCSQHREGK